MDDATQINFPKYHLMPSDVHIINGKPSDFVVQEQSFEFGDRVIAKDDTVALVIGRRRLDTYVFYMLSVGPYFVWMPGSFLTLAPEPEIIEPEPPAESPPTEPILQQTGISRLPTGALVAIVLGLYLLSDHLGVS